MALCQSIRVTPKGQSVDLRVIYACSGNKEASAQVLASNKQCMCPKLLSGCAHLHNTVPVQQSVVGYFHQHLCVLGLPFAQADHAQSPAALSLRPWPARSSYARRARNRTLAVNDGTKHANHVHVHQSCFAQPIALPAPTRDGRKLVSATECPFLTRGVTPFAVVMSTKVSSVSSALLTCPYTDETTVPPCLVAGWFYKMTEFVIQYTAGRRLHPNHWQSTMQICPCTHPSS